MRVAGAEELDPRGAALAEEPLDVKDAPHGLLDPRVGKLHEERAREGDVEPRLRTALADVAKGALVGPHDLPQLPLDGVQEVHQISVGLVKVQSDRVVGVRHGHHLPEAAISTSWRRSRAGPVRS